MAKPNRSTGTKVRGELAAAVADQLSDIMGHFMEALALVVVTQRSLESVADAQCGDETDALRVAVELLRRTYNELDAFAMRCSQHLQLGQQP
jgi:hypothetical protein